MSNVSSVLIPTNSLAVTTATIQLPRNAVAVMKLLYRRTRAALTRRNAPMETASRLIPVAPKISPLTGAAFQRRTAVHLRCHVGCEGLKK